MTKRKVVNKLLQWRRGYIKQKIRKRIKFFSGKYYYIFILSTRYGHGLMLSFVIENRKSCKIITQSYFSNFTVNSSLDNKRYFGFIRLPKFFSDHDKKIYQTDSLVAVIYLRLSEIFIGDWKKS